MILIVTNVTIVDVLVLDPDRYSISEQKIFLTDIIAHEMCAALATLCYFMRRRLMHN